MVLKESEPEGQKAIREVEEKNRSYSESVQRTQKGFQILSERGETVSTWLCYGCTAFQYNQLQNLCSTRHTLNNFKCAFTSVHSGNVHGFFGTF